MDIDSLSEGAFQALPLVIEGESKEIRYLKKGLVAIRFKPTVYSFTHNRCETIKGSEMPRMQASKIFMEVLREAGLRHAYRQVGEKYILADLVMPHDVEFQKYRIKPFVPSDLTEAEILALPKAPPIEVIAKKYLTGTTKHGNIGMSGSSVRSSHPFYAGMKLKGESALPEMLIRFDWRNPLSVQGKGQAMCSQILSGEMYASPEVQDSIKAYGDRTADTVLPTQLADLYIDVKVAQRTAFLAAKTIEEFLATKNIVFYDLCMFIDESGTMIYGEVSPDCGRYRHLDLGSLDKDVWRTGGSSAQVLEKWNLLVSLLQEKT